MDYYKCEQCGKLEDEFEFNFLDAQRNGRTFCSKCLRKIVKINVNKNRENIIKNHSKCLGADGGEDFGEIFCYHVHVMGLDYKRLAKHFKITLTELAEITSDHIKRL